MNNIRKLKVELKNTATSCGICTAVTSHHYPPFEHVSALFLNMVYIDKQGEMLSDKGPWVTLDDLVVILEKTIFHPTYTWGIPGLIYYL